MMNGEEEVVRDSKGRVKMIITRTYKPDPERMKHALFIILGYSEAEIEEILAIPVNKSNRNPTCIGSTPGSREADANRSKP